MLRRIHERLRLIGYYSAPRGATGWSRATDGAVVVTLLLAVPVACLTDLAVTRRGRVEMVSGTLYRAGDGAIIATELDGQRPGGWSSSIAIGQFDVTLTEERRGWPLVTTVARRPLALAVGVWGGPSPGSRTSLEPDDPMRVAVDDLLAATGRDAMREAWIRHGADRQVLSWFFSAAILWVMMAFVSLAAIRTAWWASRVHAARRAGRRARLEARGRCVGCGYDMQGLDFSERCPECGALV